MHNDIEPMQSLDAGFGALFEDHVSIMLLIDPSTGMIRRANQAAADFYGYPRSALCAMDIVQICADEPDQLELVLQQALRKEQNRFVRVHRTAGGDLRTVEIHASPTMIDGQLALFSIVYDITERVRAEQALRQSELRYRSLIDSLDVSVCRWRPDTTLVFANEQYRTMFGIEGDPTGRQWLEFLPEAAREETATFYRELARSPRTVTYEHPVTVGDDQVRHYQWIDTPIFDAEHQLFEFQSVGIDISERLQREAALRVSEELYRTLITSQESIILTMDADGVFHYINQIGAAPLTGAPETVIGKRLHDFIPPQLADDQLAQIRQVIASGQGAVVEIQHLITGQPRWYHASIQPLHGPDGHVALAMINALDITARKQAEQALRELNQTLEQRVRQRTAEVQDLYENAPVGYPVLDTNGTILMINQTQIDWLGYSREELLGQSMAKFLTPASRIAFVEGFPAFKEQGSVRDVEFEMVRKDGTLIPVLLSATAVYDEQGAFVLSRSTIFDNSERKQAETAVRESEAKNRLLFEESPDAIVLFRENGTMAQLNRAFEQLTGYRAAQLLDQTLERVGLVPQETVLQLVGAVTDHIQDNTRFAVIELRLRRASGEFRDVGVRAFGLSIRGQQHYLATMRDITAEKQVEETLRQANAELARAARAKDEFLANMSHELRTPLNAILGLSETLLEEVRGPLNSYQQGSVRNIEASGRHLLALITDILDLSKVESGRLDLQVEPVIVAEVCQASLLFVKEQALKKSLRLAFTLNDQMAEMESDARRLKQMLVNLLSNAVKFTPDRGQVRLDVDADTEAGVIRFAVQDTGIGIAADDLTRLFQPFKQLDSSLSRQHEGTGLGLALVRRLAELHGGSIVVESEPGKGSCFTISLPYRLPPPARGDARLPASDLERRPALLHSALVVEDSESAAEQLTRYLQEASVRVFVHRQGVGALDQAIRLQPNVIFLDILMPDRSGWEVLALLKGDPRTHDIPVVIVTVVDDRVRGLAAGAAEYILKPFTREVLRRTLHIVVAATDHDMQQALVIVPYQAPPPPTSARILLVEDNEVNILAISDYLQSRGYALSVARNGREALSQLDESRPDLILMDIQMPEMDGLEATRRVRAIPAYAQVPIIALTALAMPGDRERCLLAGANEYLTKPVSLKALAERIQQLLDAHAPEAHV